MNEKIVQACRSAFAGTEPALTLGAPMSGTECAPEALVRLPLAMMNRHGLIAGATGTGKTKTLQLMAEQLVPGRAGVPRRPEISPARGRRRAERQARAAREETGRAWKPTVVPMEFWTRRTRGAAARPVPSFGPLLLSKVLDLNDTQAGVLALVFKYCDDRALELLDFGDLRAVLAHLTGAGAADLKDYGGISKPTVGVLQRKMVELEQQGALAFFGEPEFDLHDLMQLERDGGGLVSVLELQDLQDKPALFSTFMMWMLARLYSELPEVGDDDKPQLVFFFDEAHLLFDGASKAFLQQVEQVVRLIRSKGVGIFVTQTPRTDVLAQLGHRVQHALRAHAERPKRSPPPRDVSAQRLLRPRGGAHHARDRRGDVTVLSGSGVLSPPFATRLIPPASRMGPLTDAEWQQRLAASPQVKKYREAINRESAEEKLEARDHAAAGDAEQADAPAARAGRPEPSTLEKILRSPVTRSVATTLTGVLARSLMGALVGPPRRRH
jgi:DNA helicase HerA-like ATPase